MRHADRPSVAESIYVDAPPERIWPLVSDITRPVAASDELIAVAWSDGGDDSDGSDAAPGVGRTFVGTNRNEHFGEWQTTATVVTCDEPREFAWDVGDPAEPNTRWRFVLEPEAGGTRVTQWGQLGTGPSGLHVAIQRFPDAEEKIVARRLAQWQQVMRATLEGVKRDAEG